MSITAGYVQYEVAFGDRDDNARRIRALLVESPHADLLVLPELAFSGYDFQDGEELASLAEPFDGGFTRVFLSELAAERNTVLVAGYAESAPEGCYNAAMLVCPDGAAFNYRKIHLFNREQSLFLPGDRPPVVVETPAGRIGMMICFDWFFPETARCLALAGAQIIAHPSNLVLPWCQQSMFARSIENGVFSITANRIGTEDRAGRELTFTGGSQVLGCRGETLAKAPADSAHTGVAPIEVADADDKSIAGLNDRFASRRPELYGRLV